MPKIILTLLLATGLCGGGCIRVQPPTDTGDPVVATPASPTTPSAPAPAPAPADPVEPAPSAPVALAYDPDMKPLFASDCVLCHGTTRADGNYRMTTYAQVMRAVSAGSASSRLVTITQPGGSMYRYLSGSSSTRQAKAAQVRTWVVTFKAQETK